MLPESNRIPRLWDGLGPIGVLGELAAKELVGGSICPLAFGREVAA